MPHLLPFLFLITQAFVMSWGSGCDDHPLVKDMYQLGRKLGLDSYLYKDLPKVWLVDTSVQGLIYVIEDFLTRFKNGDSLNCEDVLCEQEDFITYIDNSTAWGKIPESNRQGLEEYLENLHCGIFNLTEKYCTEVGPNLQKIADRAQVLTQLNLSNYSSDFDRIGTYIQKFLNVFEAVNKNSCARLNRIPYNYLKVDSWYTPYSDHSGWRMNADPKQSDAWDRPSIPEEVIKSLEDFKNYVREILSYLQGLEGDKLYC